MSGEVKASVQIKIAKIQEALAEAQNLVVETASELRQSGLDGDTIMSEIGFQVMNASEALDLIKPLLPT